MNEKTVWESYTEEDKKKVYDFCEEYRTFLSKCKTERECVKEILKEAVPYRKRTYGKGHEYFRSSH